MLNHALWNLKISDVKALNAILNWKLQNYSPALDKELPGHAYLQYLLNTETNSPPPIINVVCKDLRPFLGTSFGAATLPICCNIE